MVIGTTGGRTQYLQMSDMAGATGLATFDGWREDLPAEGGVWRFGDFEVALKATIGGVGTSLGFEFENHDLTAHALTATFARQDKEFPKGLLSCCEAQAAWETPEASVRRW